MVCSLPIWLDDTVLGATLETPADPVRGLDAGPAGPQWATGSYTAWIMSVALLGAAVLLLALRPARRPAAAGGAPEPARDGGPAADETAPRSGAADLTAREGDDAGTR